MTACTHIPAPGPQGRLHVVTTATGVRLLVCETCGRALPASAFEVAS